MVASSSLLQRLIQPSHGDLSPEHARYLLSLTFPEPDQLRFAQLSQLARDGKLSSEEQLELDEYLEVNSWLSVLQSKARSSLKSARYPA